MQQCVHENESSGMLKKVACYQLPWIPAPPHAVTIQ